MMLNRVPYCILLQTALVLVPHLVAFRFYLRGEMSSDNTLRDVEHTPIILLWGRLRYFTATAASKKLDNADVAVQASQRMTRDGASFSNETDAYGLSYYQNLYASSTLTLQG